MARESDHKPVLWDVNGNGDDDEDEDEDDGAEEHAKFGAGPHFGRWVGLQPSSASSFRAPS